MDASSRQLYSWACDPLVSGPSPHAFAEGLGLGGERIALLESSEVRVCVVTQSGKVATFYDKLLRGMCVEGGGISVWREGALVCGGRERGISGGGH